MGWFKQTERERWASPHALSSPQCHLGLPALDPRSRELYERALPRNVLVPRFAPDRPPVNYWMSPRDLSRYAYLPGQIILGKLGGQLLGYLDDRPMVTIAGARAGKTSTILEPNLHLYPGSMLVLDPKGELTKAAILRRALGHDVHVLDPFGQSGETSACFNVLAELDPTSWTIIDDVNAITHALVIDDGDARSKHWTESARALLAGIILLTLMLPDNERNLISMRQMLLLTHPRILAAMKTPLALNVGEKGEEFFNKNVLGIQTLLGAMSQAGQKFDGVLASIGNRFINTPQNERGSIFSTAAAQTDFLDSLPLRHISRHSDFRLASLRGDRPATIVLCLPVGRMESHYRWLRLIVQMACTVLEQLGAYPRNRLPIIFMMEEFAVLGHMEIMERAAAYFPSFGVKLHAVLQDITQLRRYYNNSWETFLGNAGLVQCFANGDQATLGFIAQRLENLIAPFEARSVFSRNRHSQLLMFEGERPAAAMRLDHEDVAAIRAEIIQQFRSSLRHHP